MWKLFSVFSKINRSSISNHLIQSTTQLASDNKNLCFHVNFSFIATVWKRHFNKMKTSQDLGQDLGHGINSVWISQKSIGPAALHSGKVKQIMNVNIRPYCFYKMTEAN